MYKNLKKKILMKKNNKVNISLKPYSISKPNKLLKSNIPHKSNASLKPYILFKLNSISKSNTSFKPTTISKPNTPLKSNTISKPNTLLKPKILLKSNTSLKPITISKPKILLKPNTSLKPNNISKNKSQLLFINNSLKKSNWIVIKPNGGLCNKLRVVFSYYYKAMDENKKLKIIWQESIDCPGLFLNYFKPIENIIFDNNTNINYANYYGTCYTTCYETDISKYNIDNIYEKLILQDFMKKRVENKLKSLGSNFIAVHIRRTDHINPAKKKNNYTTDEEFINFIEKYNTYNLYLATDNQDTQLKFYNKYKNRIKGITFIQKKDNVLRQTSLEAAIIDIFTCSHAKFFLGSGCSSFSTTINRLIKLRNK